MIEEELSKKIKFDGIHFWFNDVCVGRIVKHLSFQKDIPKETMLSEKMRCIDNMMNISAV